MTWTALLEGCERQRALEVVDSIADYLRSGFGNSPGAWSLADGRAGGALFFAYLGRARGDDDAYATAAQLIEESHDAAIGEAVLQHLFNGVLGVAWTLASTTNPSR